MDIYDVLEILTGIILLAFGAATIWSIIAFIQEVSKAKADGRKVKTGVKAFFITMMVLNALIVGFFIVIFVLAMVGLAGM